MSGPIVRRYGFPNFEKIFGERALQHGGEENEAAGSKSQGTSGESTKRADQGSGQTEKADRKES